MIKINHLIAHLFRKAIPTIALNAAQNLALTASTPLWKYTWHVDFLKQLNFIAKYPFDYHVFPNLAIVPFDLDFPVFSCDDWKHILDYAEQSLAHHVWRYCPLVQKASPSVLATEESIVQLLADCARGIPLFGDHEFSLESTMNWQQGYPLLRKLFEEWAGNAPPLFTPHFAYFPVQLSCVISRLIPLFDIPFSTPSAFMLTGSQLIFYWHKAILALDRKIGPQARCELLADVFTIAPHQGGKTYTFKGDVLLTMIQLAYNSYLGYLQPSFLTVFADFAYAALAPTFSIGWGTTNYLTKVYQGQLQESFLDPIIHYFLMKHLSLYDKHPDIFPRYFPPMDWSFYFPPGTRPSHIQAFEPAKPSDLWACSWSLWHRHETYPDMIASLRFKDATQEDTCSS